MVDEPKVKVKVYLEDFLAKFQLVTNKVTSWGSTTSDDKYPSEKLVKDSLDAKASSTHTHGNITNDGKLGTASRFVVTDSSKNITVQEKLGNITLDGKVGSSADYFLYTTTSGTVTSKQKIGNITTSGAIGSTSGLPVITTTSGVLTTGSFGSTSGTFSEGNHNHTGTYAPLSHNHVLDDITDYLVTSISCDNYNPTIDGTVTVTVFVGDSDGNGVQGVSVPVTASSGNFTKLNGASITAASTVTGTTGVNGTFTLIYSCSEWGLITFSAKNHNTLQILVKGYKDWYNYNNLILQANKLTGMSKLSLNRNLTINANSRITLKEAYTQGSDNEVICPPTTLRVPTSQDTVWIQIDYLGKIVAINTSNSNVSNVNVQCYTSWSFKNNNY